jgi:hypothetical protein
MAALEKRLVKVSSTRGATVFSNPSHTVELRARKLQTALLLELHREGK